MRSRARSRTVALALGASLLLSARLVNALCAPSARGIFPASGIVGTSVSATVPGMGLAGATASVFGEPGLAVTVQNAADLAVSLQLQIDAAAAPGERIISLTTPAGTVAVSFTVNPVGGPIVADVSPTPIATQGFGLDLAITGQNLAGLATSNVIVSGTGITVAGATAAPDGTLFDVSLDVAADASLGTQALIISSSVGGALLQLQVQRPAPTIVEVSPGAGEVGATVPLTITGANLTGAALVITSGAGNPGGVTVSSVATPDDATLTATLTIDGGLSLETEPRLLIVTTESGQTTAEFFIVAPGVPTLTGIRPGAGEPGETVNVELRGLNLTGATLSTTSPDLTLQNVIPEDDETITVDVVIAPGAAANTDHPITATVGLASSSINFHIVAPDQPFISAVRPPFGNRGSTFAVIVEGVNLSTVVPGTGIDVLDPTEKVTESNAVAIDDETARAILDVDLQASIGPRSVRITTANGSFTKDDAFRVNNPGQIPIITDVSPHVVDPGTTTAITVTGSGFDGAGVLVTGPGATVTNIVVDPTGTIITFDLTLTPDAPAETRQVIVVTENGIATCGILSSAPKPELRAAKLVKTGSVFEVLTAGFRLFLFEFSLNDQFVPGPRTYTASSTAPLLVLSQLQAENVGRAVRDLSFGYVRVRAVTTTNQIGTSDPYRFRR